MTHCLFCNKELNKYPTAKFCNSRCHGQYKSINAPKNKIDIQLEIHTQLTGGQITHGLYTEIARILGVSKERVRQRANKLGLINYREIIKDGLMCKGCKIIFIPSWRGQAYHNTECKISRHQRLYLKKIICINCGRARMIQRSQPNSIYCRKCYLLRFKRLKKIE